MKKLFVIVSVAILFVAAVSNAAQAAGTNSPAEFKNLIETIQSRQARQRADIKDKLLIVRAINARKVRPGRKMSLKFLGVIENIQANQARDRARVALIVGKKMLSSR